MTISADLWAGNVHEISQWGDDVREGRMRRIFVHGVKVSAFTGCEHEVRWHIQTFVIHLQLKRKVIERGREGKEEEEEE